MFRTNGLWLLTSKRLSIVLLPFSSFSYSAQIRLHIRSRVCNISICWYSQIRTAVSRDRHYLLWILIDDQQRALVLETLNLSSWTRFDQSPFLVVLFFFFLFHTQSLTFLPFFCLERLISHYCLTWPSPYGKVSTGLPSVYLNLFYLISIFFVRVLRI